MANKGKYNNSEEKRPIVLFSYKDLYIRFTGKETRENVLGIVLQETENAYLIRESVNYPNVPKEESDFSTNPHWYPKSKITNIKEVGIRNDIYSSNKKIVWND